MSISKYMLSQSDALNVLHSFINTYVFNLSFTFRKNMFSEGTSALKTNKNEDSCS